MSSSHTSPPKPGGCRSRHSRPKLRSVVNRELPRERVANEVCVTAGGQVMTLRQEPEVGPNRPRGQRREVRAFSYGSRRRLLSRMASVDQHEAGLPLFLTLTYPREWSPDSRRWKRDQDAFQKRLVRRYPKAFGVWRLEFQERGAPHFHLLVWGIPRMDFDWLDAAWFETVESGDLRHLEAGCNCQKVLSWNGVMNYTAKYIAKEADEAEEHHEAVGRWWGVFGRDRFPFQTLQMTISGAGWYRLRRWVRRLAAGSGAQYRRLKKALQRRGLSAAAVGSSVFLPPTSALKLMHYACAPP